MQFEKTETFLNLAKSFAGESQAGMRYQLIARAATQEGYKTLADEIKKIAKNETVHARRFFEELQKNGGGKDDIVLNAGYPFHSGTLKESLSFAAADEKSESSEIYPTYAEIAKKDGFLEVAALYRMIAEVEERHNILFEYLADAIENGTLYKSEKPTLWICSECGYAHVAEEAWQVCPLCAKEQGYVELHLPFEGTKICKK